MHTIFYSWQSDLPGKYSRNFIEGCLKKALININRSEEFIVELNLDRDTRGEPGTPDIVNTIFKKIANANIFLCDISIINGDSVSKKCPNPNVLLELGYAAHCIGWENIICVYNSCYGPVEDLPFDLKFRRPVIYQYDELNEKNKDSLISQLEKAVKACDPNLLEERKKTIKAFANESSIAQRIAIEKPDYWEFKLCEAITINKLEVINTRYADIKKGIVFKKKKYIPAIDFFRFTEKELDDIISTIEGLKMLISKDLILALGPPGKPGNARAILVTLDNIFTLLDNFLEWEITFRCTETTEKLDEVRLLMLGMCELVLKEFDTLPMQFKQVYTDPKSQKVHRVTLTIDTGINTEKISQIVRFYKANPKLLLEN